MLRSKITPSNMSDMTYPALSERAKAAIADSACLLVLMIVAAALLASVENAPESARIAAFVFVFGLYDPILTSVVGGTMGHLLVGIRVKRDDDRSKNVPFPLAVVRFIVKVFLGWISFLTVPRSRDKRAIHDMVARSVVVYKQ